MRFELTVADDHRAWLRTRVVWRIALGMFDDWLTRRVERWREYKDALERKDQP